ncbi:MAG: hypothetical protein BWY82_00837 [Verrucomicrobia bacterium ADurb.Bin474]|nr:MAG: hypothetical protein BWY82_00837 [Verrucomicrobia bacterium ADurb.Bin474]
MRLALHDIAHAGRHVSKENRKCDSEPLQYSINARVGISASGRNITRFPACLLVGGVSDG